MPVNKDSPLYADYIAACKALFDEASKREQAYLDEYPNWLGQDHPNGEKIKTLMNDRNRKFRQIQSKYGMTD